MREPPSNLSESVPLPGILRGDRDAAAWKAFVGRYGPVVFRQARRRGLQNADADDLTQEVLVEVARSVGAADHLREYGCFRAWLATLTRRRLGRFFRRLRRVRATAEAARGDGPLAGCVAEPAGPARLAEVMARVLRAALERVRPAFTSATWRAFELVWLECRPATEAARLLGVPVEGVYVAKSRVLRRLEREVRHLAEDAPALVPLR